MKHWKLILIFTGFASAAGAKDPTINMFPEHPWFTGPLIAPSALVTPAGNVNIEPYFTVQDYYGDYNSRWKVDKRQHALIANSVSVYCTIGLTKWMDFAITPGILYNVCQGKRAFFFTDLHAGFDLQLLTATLENNLPSLKLEIRETFPIAKYDHLDPDKNSVDAGGNGAYTTELLVCLSRMFHWHGDVWFSYRLFAGANVSTRIHVKGYNFYGGAADTDGYVYPPPLFWCDLSFELSLSKRWALACDFVNRYNPPRKFEGNPGTASSGSKIRMTKGSSAAVWLAPAVEYNWNDHLGIISGVWFTATGRRTRAFAAWQTGLNYVF